MSSPRPEPTRIDVTAATFFRALGVIVLAWLWLLLWQWLLIVLLGVFLAIGFDPLIQRMHERGFKRNYAAPLVMLALVVLLGYFLVQSGQSLVAQASLLGERLEQFRQQVMGMIPPSLQGLFGSGGGGGVTPESANGGPPPSRPGSSGLSGITDSLTGAASYTAGALAAATTAFAVALVVAVYLLIDGRRTYAWLVAFTPKKARPRVEDTACHARDIIAAYIRGNIITSVLSFVCTWIVLAILQVPAALLLALLAGVMDLLPVIGFILSAIPAILLGLTVSGSVGLMVAGFFVLYNVVENYYIQPKVYGRQLQLSDLAVIAAFLVGAELGGVLGALVALPIAAMYPVFEDLWLRPGRNNEVAEEHRRIESQPEH